MISRPLLRILRYFVFISVFASVIHLYLTKKGYNFNSRQIQRLAEQNKGTLPSQSLRPIRADLIRKASPHIIHDASWLQFHSGGLQGKLLLLHASLTELVAIVGTPMATAGYTGIHWMNTSCTLLTGTVEMVKDGQFLTKQEFRPGETIRLKVFEGGSVRYSDDTWMLCYSRGFVPLSGPYFLGNSLLSSFDLVSAGRMLYAYGQAVFNEYSVVLSEYWQTAAEKIGLAQK